MTDEEKLAEEYAEVSAYEYKDRLIEIEDIDTLKDAIAEAYLAALKAGRPKWHKVSDGDLPKVGVQVLSEQGTLVIYKGDGFNWVEYSPNADNIKLRKWEEPIAWCEKPQYTGE